MLKSAFVVDGLKREMKRKPRGPTQCGGMINYLLSHVHHLPLHPDLQVLPLTFLYMDMIVYMRGCKIHITTREFYSPQDHIRAASTSSAPSSAIISTTIIIVSWLLERGDETFVRRCQMDGVRSSRWHWLVCRPSRGLVVWLASSTYSCLTSLRTG